MSGARQPATGYPSGAPEERPTPVTLSERLQTDLTQAIRDRDEMRRDTLRMAISAAYNLAARTPAAT